MQIDIIGVRDVFQRIQAMVLLDATQSRTIFGTVFTAQPVEGGMLQTQPQSQVLVDTLVYVGEQARLRGIKGVIQVKQEAAP